jgi:kelch-like protein 10
LLDINTNEWKSLHPMSDGRDLRNKLVSVNGNVYAMGGNNFLAEKYSCKRNEWSLLSSYQHLVNDNLDSWACALHYEIPGAGKYSSIDIKNDSMVQGISQQMLNYQYYHYEGDPYYEDEVLDESQVFERDW